MPAHDAGLTMLPKKKTLKATKLRSSMNFRMIQAVIKCFERSTVERIEENSNVSRCLVTRCKYGHCEMRNKKLINSISHYSESDSVSSRVFYSAVSTAPPFLLPRSRRLGGLCSASGLLTAQPQACAGLVLHGVFFFF